MISNKILLSKLKKPILIILSEFIGIKDILKIFKINKSYQSKLNIGLCSYKIFSIFRKGEIDILNSNILSNYYKTLKSYFNNYSLEEIQNALCICILYSLNYNYSYDAKLKDENLYPIYSKLINQYNVDINLIYTEQIFKKCINNINYDTYIKKKVQPLSRITLVKIPFDIIIKYFKDSELGKKLFCNNLEIKHIYFKEMKFTKDIIYFLNYFKLNNIESLSFSKCRLTLNAIDIVNKKIILKNEKIKKIIWMDCFVNVKNIGKFIQNNENISSLSFKKNSIDDEGMYVLYKNNNNLNKLIQLDLSTNKLTNLSFENIGNNFMNLKCLNLSNNLLKDSIKYIFKWNNQNLNYLNLSFCQIEDNDFKDDIINNLINLNTLILNLNNINKKGIRFCFSIQSLITLKISNCNLNDDSFSLLNDLKNNNLINLSMSHNNLSNKTIISIFQNSVFQKLYLIDLSNNKLDNSFFVYLNKFKKNLPIKIIY